jgi:hypothetical protein
VKVGRYAGCDYPAIPVFHRNGEDAAHVLLGIARRELVEPVDAFGRHLHQPGDRRVARGGGALVLAAELVLVGPGHRHPGAGGGRHDAGAQRLGDAGQRQRPRPGRRAVEHDRELRRRRDQGGGDDEQDDGNRDRTPGHGITWP